MVGSVPMNYSNSAYFYSSDVNALGAFNKTVDAQTRVTVDYSDWIAANLATLSSVAFTLDYGTAPPLIICTSVRISLLLLFVYRTKQDYLAGADFTSGDAQTQF